MIAAHRICVTHCRRTRVIAVHRNLFHTVWNCKFDCDMRRGHSLKKPDHLFLLFSILRALLSVFMRQMHLNSSRMFDRIAVALPSACVQEREATPNGVVPFDI